MEPNEPGKGYEFENKIIGGTVPKEYINPINQGIQEASKSGIIAGYEVLDFKVRLIDGSYHEVDSSEMAFKVAGSMAFKEAMRKADPMLLEPIMKVVVMTPDDYMGDIMGDLSSRRGRIDGLESRSGGQSITAHVPLSEMFGYATSVRSSSQGRATFSMEFANYAEVPKSVQERIIEGRKVKD
jgi:elongation factor G